MTESCATYFCMVAYYELFNFYSFIKCFTEKFISCFSTALQNGYVWLKSLTDEQKCFANIAGKQFLGKIMFHFDIF